MATSTPEKFLLGQGFIVDPKSINRTNGKGIDWANVNDSYKDATTGKKVIPAGTPVGSLLSGNGTVSPRIVTTNPAIGILETTAVEDDPAHSITGYSVIVGGVLFDNLLPGATGTPKVIASAIKTELAATGTGFSFQQYTNNIV